MFQVDGEILDFDSISLRDMGYGQNDLNGKEKSFLWKESIIKFLSTTSHVVDTFILQCKVDDDNQSEPDIPFLVELNYPTGRSLIKQNPESYCELIYDYDNILLQPFFLNRNNKCNRRYMINGLNSVTVEENEIIIKGTGCYFGHE